MITAKTNQCIDRFSAQGFYPIHQLFEQHVEITPKKIAVIDGNGCQLTYQQLNQRANQLANYLINRNIQTGSLIAISMQRSVDLLVGFLGILKAGCSYVPIDPSLPRQRIAEILEDSQAKILLTQTRLVEEFFCLKIECIPIERIERENIKNTVNPLTEIEPQQTVYVIYTSGSTGKPKGVDISHAALKNVLLEMQKLISMDQKDSLLAITTISFDISMLEFYLPLLSNATCVIAKEDVLSDPEQLIHLLNNTSISVMQATPIIWHELLEAGWFANKALKVLCGGEALSSSLANRIIQKQGALWNLYGPTETTVWATAYYCTEVDFSHAYLPIGTPFNNVQCYVLDEQRCPVADGEVGELYISGCQVANGYLNNPQLTQDKFFINLFSEQLNSKYYATGDTVYRDSNKILHYVSRQDNQIKIRGHRVELREIEKNLLDIPEVKQAVVIYKAEEDFSGKIIAYIVGEKTVPTQTIRKTLTEKLPRYMLPHQIFWIENFPRTSNQKIDKRALLVLSEKNIREYPNDKKTTMNETQEKVFQIWQEVFKSFNENLTAESDFFEIGGNSLHATRIIAKVNQTFNLYLPINSVFQFSTIAQFCEYLLSEKKSKTQGFEPIEILQDRTKPFPLSSQQEQLYFLHGFIPNPSVYNIFYAYELKGDLSIDRLENAFIELIKQHESLRTKFILNDIEPQQVVLPIEEIKFSLPVVDLTSFASTTINQYLDEEKRYSFDLSHAPLLRVRLLKINDAQWILTVTMHHIIMDGWSNDIFKQDLSYYYNAEPMDFDKKEGLKTQYINYAVWQKQWLQRGHFESQLTYWKEKLHDLTTLNLPLDYPLSNRQNFSGKSKVFTIDKQTTQKIREFSKQNNVTLFVTLLAVFNLLLRSVSKQKDIIVGSPVSGRHHIDMQNIIGFFANMLLLRNDLSDNPNFSTFLQRVKQTTLEAFANQDIPFERIVKEFNPTRWGKQNPFFQVGFTFQHWTDNQLRFDNVTVSDLQEQSITSKFELILFIREEQGQLNGFFEYSSELFKEESIIRLIHNFQQMLDIVLSYSSSKCEKVISQLSNYIEEKEIDVA